MVRAVRRRDPVRRVAIQVRACAWPSGRVGDGDDQPAASERKGKGKEKIEATRDPTHRLIAASPSTQLYQTVDCSPSSSNGSVEEELRSLTASYKLKHKEQDILPFVITLERATLRQVRRALDSIRNRDYILIDPVWFPIWDTR